MRNLFCLAFLLAISFHAINAQNKNGELISVGVAPKKSKSLYPKAVKNWMKNMAFIPSGTFIMGQSIEEPIVSNRDSFLLQTVLPERQVSVQSFFMSKQEVSNLEYRLFYEAKVKELGMEAAAIFKPDTTMWEKEFPHSFNKPMVEYYFSHPAYDNYPVVGVSWEQANAYCAWLTQTLNKELENNGLPQMPAFRLPTEAEWEYAAIGTTETAAAQNFYGWDGYSLYDKKGLFQCNFGPIIDQNGVFVKESGAGDVGFYTAPTVSYLPNDYGLYNMSGNVSEWVADVAVLLTNNNDITNPDRMGGRTGEEKMLSGFREKINKLLASNDEEALKAELSAMLQAQYPQVKEEERQAKLDALLRDAKLLYANPEIDNYMRVMKGGSWFDGPYYLRVAARQSLAQKRCSSRVGFRVAMTRLGQSTEDRN